MVLERLGVRGAVLVGAKITSKDVSEREAAGFIDPSFLPTGFALPIALSQADPHLLRRGLGHAGALVDSKPGSSGNTTRRMTLVVRANLPAISGADLGTALAKQPPPTASGGEPPGDGAILAMLTDVGAIDSAMGTWLDTLESDARAVTRSHRWIASEAIMFSREASDKREAVWDVELGVRASGAPWSVQINAPLVAADANGLATVARDAAGRQFLIRQGWLRPNPDSAGEIRGDRFRDLSGLTPISVTGGVSPERGEWYVVTELGVAAKDIRRQTATFVHACARARLASLGTIPPAPAPPLFASDEQGGVIVRKAVDAQPAKEVRRLQGEVWLELKRLLEGRGLRMTKPRHDAGYEVDGVIDAPQGPILLEIKTADSAADVYEGVGQLMLYSEMLRLADHRRILLLPARPHAALISAAEACGLEVHDYELAEVDGLVVVTFSKPFLQASGL